MTRTQHKMRAAELLKGAEDQLGIMRDNAAGMNYQSAEVFMANACSFWTTP